MVEARPVAVHERVSAVAHRVVQTAILRKTYIRCRAADIDDSPCVFQRTGCRFGYRYLDAVLDGLNGQRPSLVVGADNRARTAGG